MSRRILARKQRAGTETRPYNLRFEFLKEIRYTIYEIDCSLIKRKCREIPKNVEIHGSKSVHIFPMLFIVKFTITFTLARLGNLASACVWELLFIEM